MSFRLSIIGLIVSFLVACQTGETFKNAKLAPSDPEPQVISGLLAKPSGNGPFPAVVILHTCGGVNTHVQYDWPEYLNKIGYVTLTVDTFGSRGLGRCPNELTRSGEINFEMTRDAYGALDHLARLPFIDKSRIAVAGFSLGAKVINSTLVPMRLRDDAQSLNFRAAIAMYGKCGGMGFDEPKIPVLVIFGDKDDGVVASCNNARQLKTSPNVQVEIFADTYHAFDNLHANGKTDGVGNYMQYSADATSKAKALVRAFLAKYLK